MNLELYNLNAGHPKSITGHEWRIGSFLIRLSDEYEDVYGRLAQNARSYTDPITGKRTEIPAVEGEWTITAYVRDLDYKNVTRPSLFTVSEELDNGLWDLLEILTFTTGRRVTIGELKCRFSPCFFGAPACVAAELPEAIQMAWANRERLVDAGLKHAILTYNDALSQTSVQSQGCLFSAALNVIIDRLSPSIRVFDARCKGQAVKDLKEVIHSIKELEEPWLSNMLHEIDGVFGRAVNGAFPKLIRVLQILTIIPEEVPEHTVRRIKWMNQLRNSIVHSGEIRIRGVENPLLRFLAGLIVNQIIPAICARAIGEYLGFRSEGLGSLCMDTDDVSEFFRTGRWLEWEVETQDVEDWFTS
jgi:hypothetical protein